jgi:cytoskeleton protein RodZ
MPLISVEHSMSDPDINGQATPSDEPNASQTLASPGAKLAAYRNERGWTVEQVASQLNLAPRQIVALESDNYAALPGMPIARGFIRAYAKLLKVDALPLLTSLDSETTVVSEPIVPRKTLSTPFSDARIPSMTDRPGLSSKWIVGVLLVLLLGVAIWASRQAGGIAELIGYSSSQTQQEKEDAPAADRSAEQADVAKTGGASIPSGTVPAGSVTESAAASTSGAATTLDSGANAAGPAASPAQPVPSATPPVPNTAASPNNNTLRLKAREDSWIEIRRTGNNSVLVSRIVKAGESETIELTEPVLLVIGNAAGVDASLRGTPVELKPGTKSNVARVNLK